MMQHYRFQQPRAHGVTRAQQLNVLQGRQRSQFGEIGRRGNLIDDETRLMQRTFAFTRVVGLHHYYCAVNATLSSSHTPRIGLFEDLRIYRNLSQQCLPPQLFKILEIIYFSTGTSGRSCGDETETATARRREGKLTCLRKLSKHNKQEAQRYRLW